MLETTWIRGVTTSERATFLNVAGHIDRICSLAANSNKVAVGSNRDGRYGAQLASRGCNTIAGIQKRLEALRTRGYEDTDIVLLFHGRRLRLFHPALSTC